MLLSYKTIQVHNPNFWELSCEAIVITTVVFIVNPGTMTWNQSTKGAQRQR